METVFPSTTWPTHVSLVTGVGPSVHGVVGNHVLNRATGRAEDLTGDPIYDAADLIRVPTFYDRAHAAGLRVAAVDWPATRHAASLAFNLPFFKDQAVFEGHTAPAVWRELAALGYPMERQGEWAQLPKRFLKDAMVADVASHVIHRHAPDLLLVHFLCVDSLQHLYGPRSPEAYWALAYVDERIGRLLATLPDPEETTVFVVSDHGFLPVTREIRPNVRLRTLGLLDVDTDVFFNSVMTPPVTNNFTSDPRIRYDRLSGRWFIIMIEVPGEQGIQPDRIMIAASDGSARISSVPCVTLKRRGRTMPSTLSPPSLPITPRAALTEPTVSGPFSISSCGTGHSSTGKECKRCPMRMLWLKSDLLLPLDKGGKLRTWHLMRHLARRHQITYLCFVDPDQPRADVDAVLITEALTCFPALVCSRQ